LIKALRWFVEFLERKFPDKVVVTDATFTQLRTDLNAKSDELLEMKKRMDLLEENLKNINTAMGFERPKMGMLER
jgi:hypothetical protein